MDKSTTNHVAIGHYFAVFDAIRLTLRWTVYIVTFIGPANFAGGYLERGDNRVQPIYTIGYGNRTPEEFLALLRSVGVQFLIDVRTTPYSKFNPYFSAQGLEDRLYQAGIKYVYLGDVLGGQPNDPSLCLEDGRADYEKMRHREEFREGIARLRAASEKGLRLAVMCSELAPGECHRSKLIGVTLERDLGVKVYHFDKNGELVPQDVLLDRITGPQLSLFEPVFASRKPVRRGE